MYVIEFFNPSDSISLCLNDIPMSDLIGNKTNSTIGYYDRVNGTISNFSWDPIPPIYSDTAPEVTIDQYREEVRRWIEWQDPFVLTVFILLILLSIGAIVAYKVNV